MAVYRFTLSIGCSRAGQEEDFDFSEVDAMGPKEKDEYFELAWLDWTSNYIDGAWEKV